MAEQEESRNGRFDLGGLVRQPMVLLLLFVTGGSLGPVGTAALLPNLYRPDPMTRSDTFKLLCLMELDIRRDMPPQSTRDHITALHEAVRKMDPSYRPPAVPMTHTVMDPKSCEMLRNLRPGN